MHKGRGEEAVIVSRRLSRREKRGESKDYRRARKSRRARKGAYISGVGRTGAGDEKLNSGEGGVKEQEVAWKGTRKGERSTGTEVNVTKRGMKRKAVRRQK